MSVNTSNTDSRVSLLDLGRQLPFEIDDQLKKELCFAETLVISCGHYEGEVPGASGSYAEVDGEESESEWTCTSTPVDIPEEVIEEPFEIKDHVEEAVPEEEPEDDDFYFYFFPDCTKPPPTKNSKDSILTVDGFPQINPAIKEATWCKCDKKKKICECYVVLPCKCGAKTKNECTCAKLKKICICDELNPATVCKCHKTKEVCTCYPGLPVPICPCHKVVKPCICKKGKFPSPICECKVKPCLCRRGKFPRPICECKFKSPYGPETPSLRSDYQSGEYEGEGSKMGSETTVTTEYQNEEHEFEYERDVSDKDHEGEHTRGDDGSGDNEEDEGDNPIRDGKSGISRMSKITKVSTMSKMNQKSKMSKMSQKSKTMKMSKMAQQKIDEKVEEEGEPCDCQVPEPKPPCRCQKGKECTCVEDSCICGVQKTCICEPSESEVQICESESSKSVCVCNIPPPECTCNANKEDECKCFPKKPICTCGDPENCKCQKVCDCTEPCICDTLPTRPEECICLDKGKQIKEGLVCTCPCKEKDPNKLKKVRAGKHGYRWCHDTDPYHTFFDYAYGRHDLIDYKEQEKEKLKILGLYDEKDDEVCPVHGIKLPRFEKKVRKPSLDCCSAVGGITISVEILGEEEDKFLVQVVSHASKEGAKTGSKLVSIIDTNLHALEENRTEYITKKELTKERKSYIAICDTGYYNKVTRTCGERNVVKRLYHNFDQAKEFLLEGSNVVLLRYFGLRRYKGSVKTQTVLMDGTICESIYVCPGVSQAIVNGKPLFVVKVERHIIEPNGFIHQTLTVLSLRGYIISHEWADNSYMLHLNPLLNIVPEKDLIEEHAPLRDKWREDLQLLSDYLDFKTTRSAEGARYVSENGQLTSTVRDYLQTILLLKPHDVMHFTRHYFDSALSSMDLPRDEYFDACAKHVRYFYFEE